MTHLIAARFVIHTFINTVALSRPDLKLVAEIQGLTVECDQYGVPRTVQGESLGENPWIALKLMVFGARLQTEAEHLLSQAAKCPATPAPITPVTPHHVALTAQLEQQQAVQVSGTFVPAKPKALHPLRGFVVTTKQKVCEVMKQMFKVGLDKLSNVQVFARLLAKYLKADVRVRVIDGVQWLLVSKGNSRKAFQF